MLSSSIRIMDSVTRFARVGSTGSTAARIFPDSSVFRALSVKL